MGPKQETLDLPLAGVVADLRDKMAAARSGAMLTCYKCGGKYQRGRWCCAGTPIGEKQPDNNGIVMPLESGASNPADEAFLVNELPDE